MDDSISIAPESELMQAARTYAHDPSPANRQKWLAALRAGVDHNQTTEPATIRDESGRDAAHAAELAKMQRRRFKRATLQRLELAAGFDRAMRTST